MIRHYEAIGLLRRWAHLRELRVYRDSTFIRCAYPRARDLGFSMADIQELLGLWQKHVPIERVGQEDRRQARR